MDNYLIDLEKLYNTYLTDELYEKITQIDEEQFMYLSEFGFSKPHLLAIPNKEVLVLTNFDDEFLFLELNDELKIETIYLNFSTLSLKNMLIKLTNYLILLIQIILGPTN